MSDDLERAVSGFLEARRNGADPAWPAIIKAALLSFLDMDEAGVERIACATWKAKTAGDDSYLSWAELPTEIREPKLASARAVLSELRKMAGEKDG